MLPRQLATSPNPTPERRTDTASQKSLPEVPPRSPSSKGSGPGLVEGPGEQHGGLLSGLRAGAVIWKVVCADSYQLEDAHGLHMVLRWQPREGRPQGHGQHPEGRLLGTEQAPGHRAGRQGHLRTHCSRPGWGTRA